MCNDLWIRSFIFCRENFSISRSHSGSIRINSRHVSSILIYQILSCKWSHCLYKANHNISCCKSAIVNLATDVSTKCYIRGYKLYLVPWLTCRCKRRMFYGVHVKSVYKLVNCTITQVHYVQVVDCFVWLCAQSVILLRHRTTPHLELDHDHKFMLLVNSMQRNRKALLTFF